MAPRGKARRRRREQMEAPSVRRGVGAAQGTGRVEPRPSQAHHEARQARQAQWKKSPGRKQQRRDVGRITALRLRPTKLLDLDHHIIVPDRLQRHPQRLTLVIMASTKTQSSRAAGKRAATAAQPEPEAAIPMGKLLASTGALCKEHHRRIYASFVLTYSHLCNVSSHRKKDERLCDQVALSVLGQVRRGTHRAPGDGQAMEGNLLL